MPRRSRSASPRASVLARTLGAIRDDRSDWHPVQEVADMLELSAETIRRWGREYGLPLERRADRRDYVRTVFVLVMDLEVNLAQTRRRAGGWGGRSLAAQGVSFRSAWLAHLEREGDSLLTSVGVQGLLLALPTIEDHEQDP